MEIWVEKGVGISEFVFLPNLSEPLLHLVIVLLGLQSLGIGGATPTLRVYTLALDDSIL